MAEEYTEINGIGDRRIDDRRIEAFRAWLVTGEKSRNTVDKYVRDVEAFRTFLGERTEALDAGPAPPEAKSEPEGTPIVTKEAVMAYKQALIGSGYESSSINSMLASLNSFFRFMDWTGVRVRNIRVQRKLFYPPEKELSRAEYERLIRAAEKRGDERLSLILQTICGTGIRIGELGYITVDAVRRGETTVSLKGKTRTVFLVRKLRDKLLGFIRRNHIESGAVFRARNGTEIGRSTVWREMKRLAAEANVAPTKVFPHALRHLFARVFYRIEKDIAKLADILGHTSIETTRIYIISTGTEHKKRMEGMRLIL